MNYLITNGGGVEIYRCEVRPTLRDGEQCFAIDPDESEQDLQLRISAGQMDTASTSAYEYRTTLKADRRIAVDAIKVTVSTGKVFDGNDAAQMNMLLALQVASIANLTATEWTLADNSRVTITLDELKEAIVLSGLAKSEFWALPV